MALVWLVLEVAEVAEVRLRLDFVDLAVQEDLMLVTECTTTPTPPALLVTDSQNLHGTDFWGEVNGDTSRAGRPGLEWRVEVLEGFVGSGVMVEEDQEYDIRVRMLSTGWRDEILG